MTEKLFLRHLYPFILFFLGGLSSSQGRFEILSLSGSFMPTDNGVTKSRSGGMSVSLAGPDGRVLGGGLAGMLVAAGPVQVHHLVTNLMKEKDRDRVFMSLFSSSLLRLDFSTLTKI